jgi:hypothetical protein
VGKKVQIGARECKKLRGVARKQFRAPAPPLLEAAPTGGAASAAVAARDTAGLAAGVAAVGASSAALGPAAAGLAAGVAVTDAAMATAGSSAAPRGSVRRLSNQHASSCPGRRGKAAAWYLNKRRKRYQ